VITSFQATYSVDADDGSVIAQEDIRVDFGPLEKHGIFREIPIQYAYDADNNRLIRLTDISVADGQKPHKFEVSDNGKNLRIKIGDPDVLVSGEQRYRITYTINRSLNPFDDHDEFYWNVTGNDWPVRIESANGTFIYPGAGLRPPPETPIRQIACYQGPRGSTLPCDASQSSGTTAAFSSENLPEGSGLTIVVGLEKGAVNVGPPKLVDANETFAEQASDFLGLSPIPIIASLALLFASVAAVLRQWWIAGRDRWYGDMFHVADRRSPRPSLGAREHRHGVTPPKPMALPSSLCLPRSASSSMRRRTRLTSRHHRRSRRPAPGQQGTEEGGVFDSLRRRTMSLKAGGAEAACSRTKSSCSTPSSMMAPVRLSDLEQVLRLAEVKEQLTAR
jgi:hypothetical protein